MPKTKQRSKVKKLVPVQSDTSLDIDHEIEQGLKAMAEKARQGDPQALKLLLAYREERKGDAGDTYFTALTEVERRALRTALVREIASLRKEIASIRRARGRT
ncbi:MAG: hypothetical protein ACE5KK_00155 [Candidatus Brocadiales bacterium]